MENQDNLAIIQEQDQNDQTSSYIEINLKKTHFVMSAPDISFLPNDQGKEIAFVGRSNAGKSSALNTITEQKNLAKTSKTPGRTQMINLFECQEGYRIVDLPGYGYAKVPLEMKKKWQRALNEYLERRESLIGLVVVMDLRNALTQLDRQIITWSIACHLPTILLLTKSDKLNQGPRQQLVKEINFQLQEFEGAEEFVKVLPFSSLNHSIGVKSFKNMIVDLFNDRF